MSGDAHAVTQQLGDDSSVNQAPGTYYPQKLHTTGQQFIHHRTNTTSPHYHTTQTVNITEQVNITTSQHNESTFQTPQSTSQQLSPQNTSQQLPHHNTTVNTTTQTQHQHTTTPPHQHRTAMQPEWRQQAQAALNHSSIHSSIDSSMASFHSSMLSNHSAPCFIRGVVANENRLARTSRCVSAEATPARSVAHDSSCGKLSDGFDCGITPVTRGVAGQEASQEASDASQEASEDPKWTHIPHAMSCAARATQDTSAECPPDQGTHQPSDDLEKQHLHETQRDPTLFSSRPFSCPVLQIQPCFLILPLLSNFSRANSKTKIKLNFSPLDWTDRDMESQVLRVGMHRKTSFSNELSQSMHPFPKHVSQNKLLK